MIVPSVASARNTRLPSPQIEGVDETKTRRLAGPYTTARRCTGAPWADRLARDDAENDQAIDEAPPELRDAAEEMLRDPHLVDRIQSDLREMLAGEETLRLQCYVVATSRLLSRPLSATIQGDSAAGKSYVLDRVRLLMPPDAGPSFTDVTAKGYLNGSAPLQHRVIFAGEKSRIAGRRAQENTRIWRELIASGRVTQRTKNGVIEVRGPIAYIDSTTHTGLFDEDATRVLQLGTDDTPEQTRRVIAQRFARAVAPLQQREREAEIIGRHQLLQRMLRRLHVAIPFAGAIAKTMPTVCLSARRVADQIIGMIQAVALLHQRQHADATLEHGDEIAATIEDYRVARRLLVEPLGRALGHGISPHTMRVSEWLDEHVPPGSSFTTAELVRAGIGAPHPGAPALARPCRDRCGRTYPRVITARGSVDGDRVGAAGC